MGGLGCFVFVIVSWFLFLVFGGCCVIRVLTVLISSCFGLLILYTYF